MNRRSGAATDAAIILTIGLVYAVVQAQLPHRVFWSNDGGEKLMQVDALLANGSWDPAIPYDPLGVEPPGSFRFAPLLPNHARVRGDRLVPIVPIYFPLLSSLPYRVLGPVGLYVLPALFSLLTLGVMSRMARSLAPDRRSVLCLIFAGLATPIFFYSLTFWEHTMAMFLTTAGLFLIFLRGPSAPPWNFHVLAAGAVMTLGAWLRGEVYVVIGATVFGLVATRRYRAYAPVFSAGVGAALIPFALSNEVIYGSIFGPQVTDKVRDRVLEYSFAELIQERWLVIRFLFATYVNDPLSNGVCLTVGVLPAIYFRRLRCLSVWQQRLLVAWTLAIVGTIAFTLLHIAALREPIAASFHVLGLWASLPILPILIAGRPVEDEAPEDAFWSFAMIVAVVGLVGFGLALPSLGGLQWGPRYVLILVPVLVLLSFRAFRGLDVAISVSTLRRAFQLGCLSLVVLGVLVQVFGVGLLAAKKAATEAVIKQVEAEAPAVIAASAWWIPEELADVYRRFPMYLSHGPGEMSALIDALLEAGQRDLLLLCGDQVGRRCPAPAAAHAVASHEDVADAAQRHPRFDLKRADVVSYERVRMFDVYFYRVDLLEGSATPPD